MQDSVQVQYYGNFIVIVSHAYYTLYLLAAVNEGTYIERCTSNLMTT